MRSVQIKQYLRNIRAGLILNANKTEIYNFKELGALRGPDLIRINIMK